VQAKFGGFFPRAAADVIIPPIPVSAMGDVAARFDVISIWVRQAALVTILLGSAPPRVLAGEPSGQVIPHRALWPDPISSQAEFDRASRGEILAFAHALAESEKLTDDALKDRLQVDGEIDTPSIQRLRRKLWKLLAGNYVMASAGCVAREAFCPTDTDPNDLRNEAEAFSSAGIEPRYSRGSTTRRNFSVHTWTNCSNWLLYSRASTARSRPSMTMNSRVGDCATAISCFRSTTVQRAVRGTPRQMPRTQTVRSQWSAVIG
jgi:hypothetical protein